MKRLKELLKYIRERELKLKLFIIINIVLISNLYIEIKEKNYANIYIKDIYYTIDQQILWIIMIMIILGILIYNKNKIICVIYTGFITRHLFKNVNNQNEENYSCLGFESFEKGKEEIAIQIVEEINWEYWIKVGLIIIAFTIIVIGIISYISSINEEINQINSKIDNEMNKIDTEMNKINEEINQINSKIDTEKNYIDLEIKKLNNKVDTTLNEINTNIKSLQSNITGININGNKVLTDINKIKQNIKEDEEISIRQNFKINEQIKSQEFDINKIKKDIINLEYKYEDKVLEEKKEVIELKQELQKIKQMLNNKELTKENEIYISELSQRKTTEQIKENLEDKFYIKDTKEDLYNKLDLLNRKQTDLTIDEKFYLVIDSLKKLKNQNDYNRLISHLGLNISKINLEKLNLEGESTFEIILDNILLKPEIRHGLSVTSNEDLLKMTLGVNNDKITIEQNDKMSNLYLDLPVQEADDLGTIKRRIENK